MNLSDFEPISYELLRVEANTEVLCDIRLEKRHRDDGPPRWRIVDERRGDELSCAGNWSPPRGIRNLNYFRFETPEAALSVWAKGVERPSILQGMSHHLERVKDGQRQEELRLAYERIVAVCREAT